MLAAAICTTVIVYWFIPPVDSFDVPPEYLLGLCIFILLCVLLIEFSAARWRIEHALKESEQRFRLMAEAVTEMLWFESIEPRARSPRRPSPGWRPTSPGPSRLDEASIRRTRCATSRPTRTPGSAPSTPKTGSR